MIEFDRAKWRLASLWFALGGLILTIVFLQALFGKFGQRTDEVWNWMLPTIMPSLTLIAGVIVADAQHTQAQRNVRKRYYYFALAISAFYLALVLSIILLEPLVSAMTGSNLFDLIGRTGIILGPLQGMATTALGIFFIKKTDDNDE